MSENAADPPQPRPGSPNAQRLDLSEQDWQRYIRRAAAASVTLGDDDLRRNGRHVRVTQCLLRVTLKEGSQVYVIHGRDISCGGMGFTHHQPLPVGADCTVVLETNRGQGQIVSGRIRWVRQFSRQLFGMGLVFDQPVNLDDLTDLADPASEANAA